MQIQIDGQGMEVSDALKTLTLKKLKRIESHIDNIKSVHITFKVNKIRQLANANVAVPGTVINAQAETNDMYKTVDLLVEKLMTQLTKYKEK